jgi:hypothetical protein
MPMWRCPHCATPQAETARCWVCHRSSTACGACRHFRRSVASQLGYCGLDRQRQPLNGDEIRACWEAADASRTTVPALPGVGPVWPLEPTGDRATVRPIEFVEVKAAPARDANTEAAATAGAIAGDRPDPAILGAPAPGEPRWSLWGEAEA